MSLLSFGKTLLNDVQPYINGTKTPTLNTSSAVTVPPATTKTLTEIIIIGAVSILTVFGLLKLMGGKRR